MEIKITEWQFEDEMTEDDMYNALYPLSRVDIVRLFPKKISQINPQSELSELVDGAYNIVELWDAETKAQKDWQRRWLEKARKLIKERQL